MQGQARDIGQRIIQIFTEKLDELPFHGYFSSLFTDENVFQNFRKLIQENRRFCFLFAGETTVVLHDRPGKGGRCQELALSAALTLEQAALDVPILLLAAGSDGIDGPTDAAGAFAHRQIIQTLDNRRKAQSALDFNDSYTFFSEINHGQDLFKIGHTNTNVMDIIIVLVDRESSSTDR